MDMLEILKSHGIDVEHIDGVPQTWADAIDRLVVDLKDMGWRGHLRSIAAREGALWVDLGGEVTPAMLTRVARAADEVRHVCEECGATVRDERPGRALCSRCATLDAAVAAALEAAPDDATLGALVYDLYLAWDLRRRVAERDEKRQAGKPLGYSSEEVFEELRRWATEGPPCSTSEPPLALSETSWNTLVGALEGLPAANEPLGRPRGEPSASDTAEGRDRFRARLRRERAWRTALASPTRAVTLSGVSSETCRALQREAGARVTYRAGALEMREPGPAHHMAAAAIAEAVATVSRIRGERLEILTAPAFEDADVGVVVAPDMAIVSPGAGRRIDLVVDIAFDDSAAWRLEVYRQLAVPEVWHFGRDAVEVLLLGERGYVDATTSALLPPLRRLTLRHIVETAIRGDLVDARRYTERVMGER